METPACDTCTTTDTASTTRDTTMTRITPTPVRETRMRGWLRSSRRLLLVGLIPAAMILAACGGDDDDGGDSASSPTMGGGSGAMVTATTGMGAGADETATHSGMDMGSPTTGSEDEASPTMEAMMTPTTGGAMASPTTGMGTGMGSPTTEASPEAAAVTSDTAAAALRATLTNILQEHVYLAGAATGAAIAGRTAEFDAAAATLDANSVTLSEAIGSIYGTEAGDAFLELWRAHITMFVNYTTAAASGDTAGAEAAAAELDAYRTTFGEFLESANPNLPADAVAAELEPHVSSLIAAIDAQVAGDPAAMDLLREAAMHMPMTAQTLAGGIVAQFPEDFAGDSNAPASELRSYLNAMFQEHVYLAGFATGAALDGRTAEFEATAATLDANSVELATSFGQIYGTEAGDAFVEQWRAHIQMLVDYTTATAAGDTAGQEASVAELTAYVGSFATFMSEATGLPEETLATLLEEHVLGLKDVVDLQAAGDVAGAYTALQMTAMHMQMLADPFAEATVQMFPDAFAE